MHTRNLPHILGVYFYITRRGVVSSRATVRDASAIPSVEHARFAQCAGLGRFGDTNPGWMSYLSCCFFRSSPLRGGGSGSDLDGWGPTRAHKMCLSSSGSVCDSSHSAQRHTHAILDNDLNYFCRIRRIPMFGHSDFEFSTICEHFPLLL